MTGLELIWSERSIKEYEALVEYIFEEWGEKITQDVIERVNITATRIQEYPEQFPLFIKSKNIRRCVMSSQTSVFFKMTKSSIEILSLFDNRQDPKKRRLR